MAKKPGGGNGNGGGNTGGGSGLLTITGTNGDDVGIDALIGSSEDELIQGKGGNDVLVGGGGTDTLEGGSGNDSLTAGDQDDILDGGKGNDLLDGGRGNDEIDGGADYDTVLYDEFDVTKYNFIQSGSTWTVTNIETGETDQVTNVEQANFNNINILLDGTNNGPLAIADIGTADENLIQSFDVIANDWDFENDALTLEDTLTYTSSKDTTAAGAGIGSISVVNNQISWGPSTDYDYLALGEIATITITYQVSDPAYDSNLVNSGVSESTLTLTITGSNDGPIAVVDTDSADENTSITVNVLANDTDLDLHDTHTVDSVNITNGFGSVAIVNNEVEWTPGTDYDYLAFGESATVEIAYDISDHNITGAGSLSDSSTLTLTITGTNDAPVVVAEADFGATEDGAIVNGSVVATDVDGDATTLIYSLTAAAPAGLVFNANGTYSFDPSDAAYQSLALNEETTVSFSWKATDQHGADSGTDTVDITITGTNDAPEIQVGEVDGAIVEPVDGAGGTFGALGEEFQISSYVGGDYAPSVTTLTDGSFVVTWDSYRQGDGDDIYGRHYAADGTEIGGEFLINSPNNNNQAQPSISSLTDGGFVVTWFDADQNNSIYGQRYDADGAKVGGEFKINSVSATSQDEAVITGLNDGGFVATWYSYGQDTSVFGQVYNESGAKVGTEFQVNTNTTSYQHEPSISSLTDGGFVVTWSDNDQDVSIYGQRFDNTGATVGAEFQVNTTTDSLQLDSDVTGLNGGGFVVTWSSYGQDGDAYGIYGQLFDDTGTTVGTEFSVNTYTTLYQYQSSVTSLSDGGFVVTWSSKDQDGSDYGIYGQRFDAAGETVGDEFVVNTTVDGAQTSSDVTGLDGGGFVVTWVSDGEIYGQRFGVDDGLSGTQASGYITFTDVDLSDRPTAGEDVSSIVAFEQDGETVLVLTTEQSMAIEAAFSITADAGNTNNGTINWGYDLASADMDFLGDGEVVTAVFTITVTDDEGVTAQQDVTITVTGTNDAPVVVAEADFGATEDGAIVNGSVVATDVDGDATTLIYSLTAAAPAGLVFNANGTYSFDPSDAAYQSLALNEETTVSFSWKATDQHGADSGTDSVDIVVTGTNDVPEIQAVNISGSIVEGDVPQSTESTLSSDDVFVANYETSYSEVFLNDGSGSLVGSDIQLSPSNVRGIDAGDLNGDGLDDLVMGNDLSGASVYLNNGDGSFTQTQYTDISTGSVFVSNGWDVALADFDGDGDLDAYMADWSNLDSVWFNNGSGTLGLESYVAGSTYRSRAVDAGDLDGDGNIDVVVGNSPNGGSAPNDVLLNNGDGTFYNAGSFGNDQTYDIDLADVDGDGDLDVYLSNYQQPNTLWLNDGSGKFTDSGQAIGSGLDAEFGDLNGDGHVDLFVTSITGQNSVWLNNGQGHYSLHQSIGSDISLGVALVDLDGDGDLDAYVLNHLAADDTFLNDGTGTFQEAEMGLIFDEYTEAVVSGNFDNSQTGQEAPGVHNLVGSIDFADLDGTDRPTAADETNSISAVAQDGSTPLELTSEQIGALGAAFSISSDAANTNKGTINWAYTPSDADIDFLGEGEVVTAVFTITITDDEGATAQQDVTIIVTGTNDAPIAVADTGATDENAAITVDVLLNDTDVDISDTHTVDAVTITSGSGSASILDNKVVWNPGTDYDYLAVGDSATVEIAYDMSDNNGGIASSTLTLTVTGTNDAPIANFDLVTTDENTSITINLLANDTDVDSGDTLTLDIISLIGGDLGSYSIINNQLEWDPGTDYDYLAAGETAWTNYLSYQISDQHTASSGAIVAHTITGSNDGPIAVADTGATDENTSITVNVLDNDTDLDSSDTHTVDTVSISSGLGSVSMVNNQVQWNPGTDYDYLAVGESATVEIAYDMSDNNGGIASSTLTLIVEGSNDAPILIDSRIVTNEGLVVTGVLVANDEDTSDTHNFSLLSGPVNGTLILNADGTFSYTPAAGYSGTDSFTYQAADQTGATSNIGTVSLQVDAVGGTASINYLQIDDLVSTETVGVHGPAAVTSLAGGHLVVYDADDSSSEGAYGQLYDANGDKLGSNFLINTTTFARQVSPSATGLIDGGFVAVWDGYGPNGYGIYGQQFDTAGVKVGSEFVVITANYRTSGPDITILADGNFVIQWTEYSDSGTEWGSYARIMSVTGNSEPVPVSNPFQTSSSSQGNQFTDGYLTDSIAALSGGGFVTVWRDGSGPDSFIAARLYDDNGQAQTVNGSIGEFKINTAGGSFQKDASVGALSDGGFVVTWQHTDVNGSEIYAQRFAADGSVIEGEFQVNSYTDSTQGTPKIQGLDDGGFVIIWESLGVNGDGTYSISGQRYDFNGDAVNNEFIISNNIDGTNELHPSIDLRDDGALVVTWGDEDNYNSSSNIEQSILVFDDLVSLPKIEIGTEGNDILIGSNQIDVLDGAAGNDVLNGLAGDDDLVGGIGSDTFVFSNGDTGTDTIQDFSAADGDVLDLTDLLSAVFVAAEDGASLDGYLNFSVSGSDAVIEVDVDGVIDATGATVEQTIILTGQSALVTGSDADIINGLLNTGNIDLI